ncbi:hypothetical protein [Nostoc sp.]
MNDPTKTRRTLTNINRSLISYALLGSLLTIIKHFNDQGFEEKAEVET